VTQTYLSPQATIDPLTSRVASAAGRLGSNAVTVHVGTGTNLSGSRLIRRLLSTMWNSLQTIGWEPQIAIDLKW